MTVLGRARAPIPVAVLTGFLGAGKTTLLGRLLAAPGMADTAVIINEFGEIGVDHLLVERADEDIVELSGGCLCCRISGDLIATLEDLLRRRDNGRIRPFVRVVIETSGLADPAPVMQAVMAHPYLSLRYRLASVVTVVDAVCGLENLERFGETARQVAVADIVVITKTDLAAAGDGAALAGRLGRLNRTAVVLDGARERLDPERVFGLTSEVPLPDLPGHDGHDHGARFTTAAIHEGRAISRAALDGFLDLVRAQYGPGLLRLKGLVRIAGEDDRPLAVHGVQHVLHPPVFLERWPDGERATRMVAITDGVDPGRMEALLCAFLGEGAAAGALAGANPLATPGTGPYRP